MSNKFLRELVISQQEPPTAPAEGTVSLFAQEDGIYFKLPDGSVVGPVSSDEIFQGPTPPENPTFGQLWLDTSDSIAPELTVFTGPDFSVVDNSTTAPVISGHRGDYGRRVEGSLGSYQANVEDYNLPQMMLEADFQLTSDNKLIVMHDETVDRTTTATGAVSSFTQAQAKALVLYDTFAPFGALPDQPLEIPTAEEFFELLEDRTALVEAKSGPASEMLAQEIVARGLQDRVLANAFTVAALQPFINAGMPTMLHSPELVGLTPQEIKDAGVTHINWRATGVAADAAPYSAVGLKVWNGGTSRYDWATFGGVRVGGISNDAMWTSGQAPIFTTDQFATKKFLPGHFGYAAEYPGAFVDRGDGVTAWAPGWIPSSGVGDQGNGWAHHGHLSPHPNSRFPTWDYATGAFPIAAQTYPWGYEFDVTYLEAGSTPTRRWGIAFAPSDRPFHDAVNTATLGYGAFCHGDATGTVYTGLKGQGSTRTNPQSAALASTIAVGQTNRWRFRWQAEGKLGITNITAGTAETLFTVSQSNADLYQGGYLWLGNPGVSGSTGRWGFSNVVQV